MTYKFSRTPKKVRLINTNNRSISSDIPCPGTRETLDLLDNLESRSMHGQIPIVWDKAEDFNIYDIKGNKFIDFTSAIFFSNIGHSNSRVSEAMKKMLDKPIIGCYAYANKIRARYLKKLVEFCGAGFEKAFLMSAGTEATEAALKLMRMHGQSIKKEKLGIITLENNWHGRTMGAQIMSGNKKQKEWIGFDDNDVHHLPFPYPWVMKDDSGEAFFLKSIDNLIKRGIDPKKHLCGMMLETFQGWGAVFYPKDYVKAAEKFCRENNIILTFDEMQAGFGRTGKAFGFQHYDVIPDLICCGKGMGNGYPLSGVIGRGEIMDLPEIGNMSSTHSANPMACAVGLSVIEEIEFNNLIQESHRKGLILREKLNELKKISNGKISHILGEGLIAAIHFENPNNGRPDSLLASIIAEKCYEKGLLVVHTGRESIKLGPPLTISDEALLEGLEVIHECVKDSLTNITIGVMQGRLSDESKNSQTFPLEEWRNEFKRAEAIGFDQIEWLIDSDSFSNNPIMSEDGRTEIARLEAKHNVAVKSICAHFLIDGSLLNQDDIFIKRRQNLLKVLECASRAEIKFIVIPLLDKMSIKSSEAKIKIKDLLREVLEQYQNIKILLECDMPANEILSFLEDFRHENIGILYDLGNANAMGFDIEQEIVILNKYIEEVHIKDRFKNYGHSQRLGKGDTPLESAIGLLKNLSWRGSFILETPIFDEWENEANENFMYTNKLLLQS